MALVEQKARDRAPQIWLESKRTASAQEISDCLWDEGYGRVKPATIRVWKSRDRWDLCAATSAIVTPADAIPFETAADALCALGVEGAKALSAFLEKVDVKAMTLAEAAVLSKIATGMISAAVMLEQKVVSKLRLNREKELAATSANAEVAGEENPLDAALAAFKRAA